MKRDKNKEEKSSEDKTQSEGKRAEEQMLDDAPREEETETGDTSGEALVEESKGGSDENLTAEQQIAEAKDKYLRLYSEFENFRRRTAKERLQTISQANADIMKDLVGVLDDFERAINANEESDDSEALKEGFKLIHNKLYKTLESKGLKPMESEGEEFDVDKHEALTKIPAPSDDLKGKVVEVVEKGYLLNDTVLRYAKVVVGQ